jgi:hypothetical protein
MSELIFTEKKDNKEIKLTRDLIRTLAAGKYFEMSKSYDADRIASFTEGALFIFDLLTVKPKTKVEEIKTDVKEI